MVCYLAKTSKSGHRKPPNFAALMGGSIFIGQESVQRRMVV